MAKTGKIYYTKIEFTDEYVAAHYSYPVMFFITDNINRIKKQITYDSTGKKSVSSSFPPNPNIGDVLVYSAGGEVWSNRLTENEMAAASALTTLSGVLEELADIELNKANKDASAMSAANIISWRAALQINELEINLQAQIDAEKTARENGDIAEANARAFADGILQSKIDLKLDKPTGGADGDILIKSGTTSIWSSIVKGIEFAGNAILKLKIITFGGYTIAQKTAIASPVEGMLIYQNESPKGFQKYENGAWTAVGSNISNADLSNVSARSFTQGNTFTWNTAGFFYYLKGLLDKTGNTAYTKVVIVHPTTGEMVTRDFADPAATTLAVQNANSSQKTAMRTALLGTATPANPVLQDASARFIVAGLNVIDLIGINLTLLDPTFIWVEKLDGTKIYATSFYNISGTAVTTLWDIPADLPNGDYPVKIQNGVTVQGLSTAVFTKVTTINQTNLIAADWKKANRKLDDGVTIATGGTATLLDNIISIGTLGMAGTYLPSMVVKSKNIFLGIKDWDIEIELQSTSATNSSIDYAPQIGFTELLHANIESANDLIVNNLVIEATAVNMRINSGFAPIGTGGNPGQKWWIYICKVGNKLYVRTYNKSTLSNYQYYQTTIDTAKNYALFLGTTGIPGGHNPVRNYNVTARIMN